jgi:hypothetical protein
VAQASRAAGCGLDHEDSRTSRTRNATSRKEDALLRSLPQAIPRSLRRERIRPETRTPQELVCVRGPQPRTRTNAPQRDPSEESRGVPRTWPRNPSISNWRIQFTRGSSLSRARAMLQSSCNFASLTAATHNPRTPRGRTHTLPRRHTEPMYPAYAYAILIDYISWVRAIAQATRSCHFRFNSADFLGMVNGGRPLSVRGSGEGQERGGGDERVGL